MDDIAHQNTWSDEKGYGKKTHNAILDGVLEDPSVVASAAFLAVFWETHIMAEEQKCPWNESGLHTFHEMQTLVEAPHQRCCVGYGSVEMDRRGGYGWKKGKRKNWESGRTSMLPC